MKILIITPSFNIGGTISALKNLLTSDVFSKHKVDLFAITDVGSNRSFFEKISNVSIISVPLDNNVNYDGRKNTIKKCLFIIAYKLKKLLCKIGFDISGIAFRKLAHDLSKNNYDIVIGYQEGQATLFASFFKCKKIAWVHCDYSRIVQQTTIKKEHKVYHRIDSIVCVSQYTRDVFVSIFPETKIKTVAIHNYFDKDRIISLSKEYNPLVDNFTAETFNIVSVGRMSPVKQFSAIPKIARSILDIGCPIKWFIIGGGDELEHSKLMENISKYQVEDSVFSLGNQPNPYPLVKASDLLVCTSKSEACPNIFDEAFSLGVPVVSTNFGSANEFIRNNGNGIITDLNNLNSVISKLIIDSNCYGSFKEMISGYSPANQEISHSLENLLSSSQVIH